MLGIGACIVLFALGVLVVLLAKGYPLLGVTIGVTGLTMCLAAATVFCFFAVIRKKKPEALENEKEAVYHA